LAALQKFVVGDQPVENETDVPGIVGLTPEEQVRSYTGQTAAAKV